jgi:hypothetical protein
MGLEAFNYLQSESAEHRGSNNSNLVRLNLAKS